MTNYLIKVLILILFSFFIIYSYYFLHPVHIENFDGYFSYFIIVLIIYGVYKYFQIELNEGNNAKVNFSPVKILGYFLLHLLVLSILFFSFNESKLTDGFILFFKILGYSILPISILFIVTGFGKKISSYIPNIVEESSIYRFLISLGIGFFSFLFLVDSIGILGAYNLYVVFGVLLLFIVMSYKELLGLFSGLIDYKIELEIEEGSYLKLISTEFLFIVSSLVLSTSLIYIVRPFPIGWDDLGVYMNFPHLLASAESIISLGGMYVWQTFTGIGYLFGSTTQAFFLNVVGGFVSFIVLILIISDLLKSDKKGFINIPLLVATIFISLPMIVFQQAKDMKLDAGLFFVSIISVYLMYKYYIKNHNKSDGIISKLKNAASFSGNGKEFKIGVLNGNFITIFIIGILAGFAFSIKFTSLLLISALIGIIFFVRLGILGFLGYLAIFFALFTKANLWAMMNVVVNPGKIAGFETNFAIISGSIGLLLIAYSFNKNKGIIKKFFIEFFVFLLGILIALLPWLSKNIVESYPDISIGKIISGTTEHFNFDKSLIYSEKELKILTEEKQRKSMSSSGNTSNEDFGRYFGYESGINNYLKLPWNLTMQKNQGGEFTDIGFLFLALIPVILLFLPFKRKEYSYFIVGILALELLLFITNIFTPIFSTFLLPFGYLIILLFFGIPVIYLLNTLKATNKNYLFNLNLVFVSFYTFLWTISAFGIVWYGIVMYFSLLLMIAFGSYYISSYKEEDSDKVIYAKSIGSIALFLVVLVYFVNSVFPHTFNNLKGASYKEYKTGQINSIEAPFLYHSEYIKILFNLNIDDNKRVEFFKDNITENIQKAVDGITTANIDIVINTLRKLKSQNNVLSISAQRSLLNIFEGITNPKEEFKEKSGIYRIGTFLMYYISENNKRVLGDSLIFNFNDYIYDENSDITVERLKKLGLKYLLVDLNAATIDKDSRHNLTDRYNKLLSTFVSDKLELIETDSVCLKVGLENYREDKNINNFMIIAGGNYESYTEDGQTIGRLQKAQECYSFINKLFNTNQVSETKYSYLIPYFNYIKDPKNKGKFDTEEQVMTFLHSQIGKSFKVLFKVK